MRFNADLHRHKADELRNVEIARLQLRHYQTRLRRLTRENAPAGVLADVQNKIATAEDALFDTNRVLESIDHLFCDT